MMRYRIAAALISWVCCSSVSTTVRASEIYAPYKSSQMGVSEQSSVLVQANTFNTGVDATGIAAGAASDLYLAAGNGLYRYGVGGTLLNQFNWFDNSIQYTDVAYGNGSIYSTYVGSQLGVTVRDATTLAQTSFFTTGLQATGIALGASSSLYIAAGNGLYHYAVNGTLLNQFNWFDNSIQYTDVAYGNGSIYSTYVGSQLGVTVRDATTLVQTNAFLTGLQATGIALAPDGTLYISAGNGLYHYNASGILLNQYSSPDNSLLFNDVTVSDATSAVPEPSTLLVLAMGSPMVVLALFRRNRTPGRVGMRSTSQRA